MGSRHIAPNTNLPINTKSIRLTDSKTLMEYLIASYGLPTTVSCVERRSHSVAFRRESIPFV